jgi:hypothetical protein
MLDRLYLPILAVAALMAIALSLVWPQGLGARSPAPFGHAPIQQAPEYQAAMRRQHDAEQRRLEAARASVRDLKARNGDKAE